MQEIISNIGSFLWGPPMIIAIMGLSLIHIQMCIRDRCRDSGAADALSTALFIMSKEEGQSLLEKYDAEALWVDRNGDIQYSPGFKKLIRT